MPGIVRCILGRWRKPRLHCLPRQAQEGSVHLLQPYGVHADPANVLGLAGHR